MNVAVSRTVSAENELPPSMMAVRQVRCRTRVFEFSERGSLMKTILSSKSNIAKAAAIMVLAAQITMATAPAFAAPVRVSGQQVLDVNAAAGGLTALQRADKIQQNLDNALVAASNRAPSAVSIVYVKGQPVVTLGGYYIATVDGASAQAAGTTPAMLAERWAGALRGVLANRASVDSYVAHLTGASSGAVASEDVGASNSSYASTSSNNASSQVMPTVHRGRVAYIPAGMTIPVKLTTALVTGVAREGDLVEAKISEGISLGDASIPAGTVLSGRVIESKSGQRLGKSGSISLKFNSMRTPDGNVTPISAHIVGGINGYAERGSDTSDLLRGETFKDKVKRTAISSAVGAGSGAMLGTAVGAIAGHGRGAGKGAWSGAAIGAGLGVAESLLWRKGAEVKLMQGTAVTLQLDAPASVIASSSTTY